MVMHTLTLRLCYVTVLTNKEKIMSTLKASNFRLASERDLRKFLTKEGGYIPTARQLGISQKMFEAMDERTKSLANERYNVWLVSALKEKRERDKEKRIEKAKSHWFFTLSDEKKKDLIIRTLKLKTDILVRRMMSPNISEQTHLIYRSAEKAEEANFVLKDVPPDMAERCLPHYDEEEDCLYGGDNRFIYCWLKFFFTHHIRY